MGAPWNTIERKFKAIKTIAESSENIPDLTINRMLEHIPMAIVSKSI